MESNNLSPYIDIICQRETHTKDNLKIDIDYLNNDMIVIDIETDDPIESVTGVTKFHGPSLGYGIPADVSRTNPLRPAYNRISSPIIEQAEPNGLFSSKNTDGTWVLFLDADGDATPVYTEHKVSTFPYVMKKAADGSWVRADDKKASMIVKIKGRTNTPAPKSAPKPVPETPATNPALKPVPETPATNPALKPVPDATPDTPTTK